MLLKGMGIVHRIGNSRRANRSSWKPSSLCSCACCAVSGGGGGGGDKNPGVEVMTTPRKSMGGGTKEAKIQGQIYEMMEILRGWP